MLQSGAATWFALGARTNVWEACYFLGVPLLVVHFAAFFSISALLAVYTRSTTACVLGTLAVWLGAWAVNYARHAAAAGAGGEHVSSPSCSGWTAPSR